MSLARAPGGGRKPLPTVLKLHLGTLRPDRRNPAEAQSVPIPSRPPSDFSAEEKRVWRQMVKMQLPAGLLTALDGPALEIYCKAAVRRRDAEARLREHGSVILGPGGSFIPSPYLAIAQKAAEVQMRLLAEFGMTPSSRSRVQATPPASGSGDLGPSKSKDPEREEGMKEEGKDEMKQGGVA